MNVFYRDTNNVLHCMEVGTNNHVIAIKAALDHLIEIKNSINHIPKKPLLAVIK